MRDGPWEICVLQLHFLFRGKKYLSVVVEGRRIGGGGALVSSTADCHLPAKEMFTQPHFVYGMGKISGYKYIFNNL
jgi:hypothetical protein